MRGKLVAVGLILAGDLAGTWFYHRQAVGTPNALPRKTRLLVVLCAGVGDSGGLDAVTAARLAFAAAEFRAGRAQQIAAIGCHWSRNRGNPGVMASELRRLRVPTRGILHDGAPNGSIPASFETLTNLQSLRLLMKRHGIRRGRVVSSPLHLLRVRALAPRVALCCQLEYRQFTTQHQRTPIWIWREAHHEWLARLAVTLLPESLYIRIMRFARRGQ